MTIDVQSICDAVILQHRLQRKIRPFGEEITLYYIRMDEEESSCWEESTVSTLGERLSTVRERRGFTQVEVARRIRLPQQAISRLERGEWQHVRSDVLARLAIALDVSADVLLGLRNIADEADITQPAPPQPAKCQRPRKTASMS